MQVAVIVSDSNEKAQHGNMVGTQPSQKYSKRKPSSLYICVRFYGTRKGDICTPICFKFVLA